MDINKQLTCCFTGHRPEKLGIPEVTARQLLLVAIDKAINDGFTTFISGMATGIDTWAAQIVLAKRLLYPDIKLVCALPYGKFQSSSQIALDILSKADKTEVVCSSYSKSCFQLRNCYMVDNSARVIAAFNGEKGGTKNTIAYAKRTGIQIVNVFEH